MQTKTILSAILATISYLEAVQGAPMPQPVASPSQLSDVLSNDWLGLSPMELPKRKASVGSVITSALKSGGLSALESGVSDIWDDISGSDDDSSTASKRSIFTSIIKEVPTILSGIEGLTDGDSSSAEKRSIFTSILKEVPTIFNGIEGLTDGDSSSSASKRSWASLLDKAEPYIESGAESLAKTVGGAVGSEVVSAGQSLASDAGLSRRKVNWGNIIESGASAGASALGDGLGSTIASGVESLASDVGINMKERSPTIDAELPKRTGIWSEVESGIEKVAPIALSALSDLKRSDTISAEMPKRSGIWTTIEHGLEDVAPIAIGALSDLKRSSTSESSTQSGIESFNPSYSSTTGAFDSDLDQTIDPSFAGDLPSLQLSPTVNAELPKRSGFLTTIEHGLEDVAPIAIGALSDLKRDNAPRSFLDELESFIGNLKSKRDVPEPRSFLDDFESFLGNLKNKRNVQEPRSFLDEFESFLGNLKNKRDVQEPRSFLDEFESFLGNL